MATTKKAPSKIPASLKHSSAAVIPLDGDRRAKVCAYSGCNTLFVPKRVHQVFCNKSGPGSCRKAYFKQMQVQHSHACPICGAIHRPKDANSPGLAYEKAPN